MPIQSGALVLIKVGNGGAPEVFTTVGGMRTSQIELNNRPLDATHRGSGDWRRLLTGGGVKSLTISGSGLFSDAASEETVRGYAFASSVNNYRFIFANGDYVTGPFLVTSYARSGTHEGEETYSLTLASAGALTFTAA